MPCYCSQPDSFDQIEIERRCKVRMYFDAQDALNHQQIEEAERQELKQFPTEEDLNDFLCKICKILTKTQMEKISAYYFEIEWSHKNLYDWHIQHCKDDIIHNSI